MREQDKHFLLSLFVALGIVFAWKGIWEGIYYLPYINTPWVFLFIGLTMLTLSGVIFNEFDPLGNLNKSANKIIHFVYNRPNRSEYDIKYHDKIQKKHITFNAGQMNYIDKNLLVIKSKDKKEEVFIPIHRITEVLHNKQSYWRL